MNQINNVGFVHQKDISNLSASDNLNDLDVDLQIIPKDNSKMRTKHLNRVSSPFETEKNSPPQYFELNRIVIGGSGRQTRPDIESYKMPVKSLKKRSDAVDGMVAVLSALYCKILVVIGICFPMAEVISHRIPIGWYEGFYLYLYLGSILFLLFVYLFLRPSKTRGNLQRFFQSLWPNWQQTQSSADTDSENAKNRQTGSEDSVESLEETHQYQRLQCGSFYLRLGAVAFGIGSMIYSGLEFGQFFELESKEHCYNFLYGFTPGAHVAFTFIQLYFIFMNSRVIIARHKLIARFGLMHMIGTNICVWLHVLIQETKHQIMIIVNPNITELMPDFSIAWEHVDDVVEEISEDYLESIGPSYPSGHENAAHQVAKRSLDDHSIYTTHGECRRSNIIGELVRDASQFLFPCTIEYSLICAAILYIMWKGVHESSSKTASHKTYTQSNHRSSTTSTTIIHSHQKHHYQVDCAKAHKGLFTGIFLMVVCIISLILFFVFIKKPQYRHLAVLQAHVVELFIYCINAIACLIAIFQVRELRYNRHRNVELDNILLIIAQIGLYIFTMFSIIGAQFFNLQQNTRLVLINALACLIQATLQSIFILDASRRYALTSDQMRRKPGREMVTFLLVCNFAMWAINTLETRRADSNPVQMHFYGFWAWTIITHVTMPLTIFYRFHSTVCLCDIWKRTYKIKSDIL